MKNRIHFDRGSKTTLRLGIDQPARYRFSGRMPFAQASMGNMTWGSGENDQLLEDRHAFAFSVAAQAIREEEKARLARELHDELAQSLTALKMDTIWVRDQSTSTCAMVTAKLTEMVEMLDRTVAATRRMAADLRPLMLDDLGLVPAIEWLTSNFMQRCGVTCTLSIHDEMALELPEPYATAVFRIIQESLNNIAKHAKASQVVVTLGKTPESVRLCVRDDGCGFFSDGARKPQSLGLMGLRERAQLLGGSVAIHSALGKGTTVEVSIPLGQTGACL